MSGFRNVDGCAVDAELQSSGYSTLADVLKSSNFFDTVAIDAAPGQPTIDAAQQVDRLQGILSVCLSCDGNPQAAGCRLGQLLAEEKFTIYSI